MPDNDKIIFTFALTCPDILSRVQKTDAAQFRPFSKREIPLHPPGSLGNARTSNSVHTRVAALTRTQKKGTKVWWGKKKRRKRNKRKNTRDLDRETLQERGMLLEKREIKKREHGFPQCICSPEAAFEILTLRQSSLDAFVEWHYRRCGYECIVRAPAHTPTRSFVLPARFFHISCSFGF